MSVSLGTAPSVWSTRRSSGRTRRRAAATGSLTHSCCTLLPTRSTPRALREHTTSYPRKPFCVTAFRRSPSRRCCKISASRSAPDPCVHRPRGWLGMGCVVCPNGSASLDPCGCRRWGGRTVREGRRGGIPCVACCHPRGTRLTPSILAIVQNRELQIMKMLDHGNVTTLHHYFYTEGEKAKRCPRTLPELHSAFSALPRARTLAPPAPRRVPDRLAPAPFAHRSLTRPT